ERPRLCSPHPVMNQYFTVLRECGSSSASKTRQSSQTAKAGSKRPSPFKRLIFKRSSRERSAASSTTASAESATSRASVALPSFHKDSARERPSAFHSSRVRTAGGARRASRQPFTRRRSRKRPWEAKRRSPSKIAAGFPEILSKSTSTTSEADLGFRN